MNSLHSRRPAFETLPWDIRSQQPSLLLTHRVHSPNGQRIRREASFSQLPPIDIHSLKFLGRAAAFMDYWAYQIEQGSQSPTQVALRVVYDALSELEPKNYSGRHENKGFRGVLLALMLFLFLISTLPNPAKIEAANSATTQTAVSATQSRLESMLRGIDVAPNTTGLTCTAVMNMRSGPGTDYPITGKCGVGTFIDLSRIRGLYQRGSYTWIAVENDSKIVWLALTSKVKLTGLQVSQLVEASAKILPALPTPTRPVSSAPNPASSRTAENRVSASVVNAPILASLIPATSQGHDVFFYNFTPPDKREEILAANPSNNWATDRGQINPHETLGVKGLIAGGYYAEASKILWAHVLNPAFDGSNQYISYLVAQDGPVQSNYAGLPFSIAEGALLLYKNVPAKDKPQYVELLRASFNLTSSTVNYWKQRGYSWRDHWESVRDQEDLPMWAVTGGAQNQIAFDLVAELGYSCKLLEEMAEILGLPNPQQDTYQELYALAQSMWDPSIQAFTGKRNDNGQSVGVLDISTFLALTAGFATRDQAEVLVRQHLLNTEEFWTAYPLPTIPKNDPRFDPTQLWMGGNMMQWTVLVIEGLLKYGFKTVAIEIAQKSGGLNGAEYFNSQSGGSQGFPSYFWGNSGLTATSYANGRLKF